MLFSIIIPVYNRPEELKELLDSIECQDFRDFEVIVVEDGSSRKSDVIAGEFDSRFRIRYLYKENGGPAEARNYGARIAKGEYLIFLDSDTVVPSGYFDVLSGFVADFGKDLFGGPDMSSPDFTPLQKAISYSMTSFFTTGGIRGGRKSITKFIPRSFNMGVRRSAFVEVGGFAKMRFGEDVDLSMRLIGAGFSSAYIPEAGVYHKRRTTFRGFYRQVCNSGRARIELTIRHSGSLRLVHLLPLAFVLGSLSLVCLSLVFRNCWIIAPIVLYMLCIFIDASIKERSPRVGLLSIVASFVQLYGYGLGFVDNWLKRCVFKHTAQSNIDNDRFYR